MTMLDGDIFAHRGTEPNSRIAVLFYIFTR